MIITDLYRNGRRWPSKPRRPKHQTICVGPGRLVGGLSVSPFMRQWLQSPNGVLHMANTFMNEGAESIIDRSIDLIADTLKVVLVTATYTPNADDQFIDAGGASDVVDARASGTTDQTLGSKATGKDTTGDFAYLDGADSTFTGVAAGSAITLVVLYKSTGTDTTSKIIAVFDIADVTPNGGDITIQWAAPASGAILKFAAG